MVVFDFMYFRRMFLDAFWYIFLGTEGFQGHPTSSWALPLPFLSMSWTPEVRCGDLSSGQSQSSGEALACSFRH